MAEVKRPWCVPALVTFGSVQVLTQGKMPGPKDALNIADPEGNPVAMMSCDC
ncbi:MAG: hypothetical protein GX552_10115 [Chloroflexi bacterium]|nr:hypothetical protein [Chloroflexota bacterium]